MTVFVANLEKKQTGGEDDRYDGGNYKNQPASCKTVKKMLIPDAKRVDRMIRLKELVEG